jgi:hypothetical protein
VDNLSRVYKTGGHLFFYVCIYLCTHVSMYLFIYVSMYLCIYLYCQGFGAEFQYKKKSQQIFRSRAVLDGQRVWPIGGKSSAQVGNVARNGVCVCMCVCVHKKEHARTYTSGKSSA